MCGLSIHLSVISNARSDNLGMRDFVKEVVADVESRGRSLKWLAEEAELYPRTVQAWPGRGAVPNVHDAVKVCKVLNRTVEDVVGESTTMAKTPTRRELDRLLDGLPDSDLADLIDLAQGKAFRRARESQSTSG
jgi:hypothetical protein